MKKKNILKILLSTFAVVSASGAAISCLYENHPTVIYAKSYGKSNPFLEKSKIANKYANQSLIDFENNLFNKPNLNINLQNVSYIIEGRYVVNNNEVRKLVKNSVLVSNEAFVKNDSSISQITNNIALSSFNEKFQSLIEKFNTYKSNPSNKKLSDLLKINFNDFSSNKQYNDEEKEIYDLYVSLNNFGFVDKSDESKVISVEKVNEVLANFFIDTPLYSEFLKGINLPENDPNSMLVVQRDAYGDVNNITFEFKPIIPFNSIPYDHFFEISKKIKSELTSYKLNDSVSAYLKIFEYMKNQHFFVTDDAKSGISSGFGPVFILTSSNPEDGQKVGAYEVFDQNSNINDETPEAAKLRKEFLEAPVSFFENNLDLVNYSSLVNAKRAYEDAYLNYSNANDARISQRFYAIYQSRKNSYELLKTKFDNFINSFKELRELKQLGTSDENTIKTKTQEVETLKRPFIADIELSKSNLLRGVEKAKTNINHLVELYAYSLFILGTYKVQLIKGTYQYPNEKQPRETYWLEFFDNKTNKWHMVDIYKGYLSYKKGQEFNYNPQEEIFTTLPSGYTIDANFVDAAHVK